MLIPYSSDPRNGQSTRNSGCAYGPTRRRFCQALMILCFLTSPPDDHMNAKPADLETLVLLQTPSAMNLLFCLGRCLSPKVFKLLCNLLIRRGLLEYSNQQTLDVQLSPEKCKEKRTRLERPV
jgi:hypothetical protein